MEYFLLCHKISPISEIIHYLEQIFLWIDLQETEKARAVREMEERLISSAFYNLSMQVHRLADTNFFSRSPQTITLNTSSRSAIESRLSSTASQPGQSFLARQRRLQVELGRIGNQTQKPGTKNPGSYKDYMDFWHFIKNIYSHSSHRNQL